MNYIDKAKQIHNGKYDYSRIKNLVKRDTRVSIVCPIHGAFEQSMHKHLSGDGCRQCGNIESGKLRIQKAREKFIEQSNQIHSNKYSYDSSVYIKAIEPITITCLIHGDFVTTPNKHLSGIGCKQCSYVELCERLKIPWDTYKHRFLSVHGNTYDYSKVEWKGTETSILVICKKHGEFRILPQSHRAGQGCQKCSKESNIQYNKIDRGIFIKRSIEIWGNRYNYSNVDYVDSNVKVRIICPIHGEFQQLPANHYKYGCGSCGRHDNVRTRELNERCKKEFIDKSNQVHQNKYTYSRAEYTTAAIKLTVTCAKHGDFKISPNNHLRGKGCPECGKESARVSKIKPCDEYLRQYTTLYGDKYDYSSIEWKGSSFPISVMCKQHGAFTVIPHYHLQGRECPKCSNIYSKVSIEWLTYMEVVYNTEIVHALRGGEFRIPETRYKADGYSQERSIIFEFHGDFWHGNPLLYDSCKINPRCGVSYGELYSNTVYRMNEIRNKGYTVVSCWESEWTRFKKAVISLQKIWKTKNKDNENQTNEQTALVEND